MAIFNSYVNVYQRVVGNIMLLSYHNGIVTWFIMVFWIYIYIYLGNLITTSLFSRTLESWLIRGIIPKWP